MTHKIINDPVYGFITIDHPFLLTVMAHPYYQRLRNIHQLAFSHLVYPGAVHSRLHHSLGAYHLMCVALQELKAKGVSITSDEELGAKLAILLHDIGHGPFSHALEKELLLIHSHEQISLFMMEKLNDLYHGQLTICIQIFKGTYPKKFLSQLVSGQLDVDRMDYLNRDSFFSGVAEGVIGYDRILKMLAVKNGELVVEEKAIYSIEKFLVSRRLMYWQVYLHKTVLSAELMMVKIIQRVKECLQLGISVEAPTHAFQFFLAHIADSLPLEKTIDNFGMLDDIDVMAAVKNWQSHPDRILSLLCRSLLTRSLYKLTFSTESLDVEVNDEARRKIYLDHSFTEPEIPYLLFSGSVSNTAYNPAIERINILYKNGDLKDISLVDHALIQQNLSDKVKKYYFCQLAISPTTVYS